MWNWTKIVTGSILLAVAIVATLPVALSFSFTAAVLIVTAGIDLMEAVETN